MKIITIEIKNGELLIYLPKGMSAIDGLLTLNDAVHIMYKHAINEEAAKVKQLPEHIQKFIDVLRKQKDPSSN